MIRFLMGILEFGSAGDGFGVDVFYEGELVARERQPRRAHGGGAASFLRLHPFDVLHEFRDDIEPEQRKKPTVKFVRARAIAARSGGEERNGLRGKRID